MRKYRKQMKRAMVFLLLLALMAAMVQPSGVAAADQTEESAEDTGEEAALDGRVSEEEQGIEEEVLPTAEEYENPGMGAEMPVPDESVDAEQESGANEDTSEESDVTIQFYAKDETGKSVIISSTKKRMKSGQTLKDIGVTLPAKSPILLLPVFPDL